MSSISIEKAKEIFENLESIVAKELGDLFFCVGKVNEQFSSICNNIRIITESIVIEPQYYDLSEEKCNRFLVSTLPILVEAIIKRPAKK